MYLLTIYLEDFTNHYYVAGPLQYSDTDNYQRLFIKKFFFITSPCCECEFGRLEWVVRGEVNVEEEHTTCKMKEYKKLLKNL